MTTRNTITRRALTAAATLAVLGVCTFAAGIEGCANTTGLRRLSFAARAGGVESATPSMTFATRTGWNVTLTEARAAVGPLYFNTIAPLETGRAPARTRSRFGWRELFVPLAHAHGESHFASGRIVAEVNNQQEIDLLSPALSPFAAPAQGIDEPVRTAELWFYNRPSLGDAAVRVRGTAAREGRTIPFSGAFAIDPSEATQEQPIDTMRQVRGIPVEFVPDEEITVELRADLRPCFANADFSELEALPAQRDGTRRFSKRDNVGAGFEAGLRSARGTWLFHIEPKQTR